MNKFLRIFSVSALLGVSSLSFAQDIHFSQFYENSMLRNPALTGVFSGDYKVGVNYRNQWATIANPYSTVAFSGETRILTNRNTADYLSLGLAAYHDKAGTVSFNSTALYPTVAYNKALEDIHSSYLSVGMTFGYLARNVDMSKMTFSSQVVGGVYNGSNASGENAPFSSMSSFDLGTGLSFNSSIGTENNCNYYLGASLFHINRPTQVFNGGYASVKMPMKWQFSGGINFIFSETWSMALHTNYSSQAPYSEMVYGGLLTYHSVVPVLESDFAFTMGAFVRDNDAIIPTVKIDYQNMAFGISYDVNNSTLTTSSNTSTGATEFTLYIRGMFNHKNNPQDGIMCPRFERQNTYPFNN